jgi:hypothetical protein
VNKVRLFHNDGEKSLLQFLKIVQENQFASFANLKKTFGILQRVDEIFDTAKGQYEFQC